MTVDHTPQHVVVDTDVVSIIHREQGERASYYETELAGRRLIVSFQTLEEIRYGMFNNSWGVSRRNEMERHLVDQYEIAWPDGHTATASARLRAKCKAAGRELKPGDAWIAATALALGCPLASDDNDFREVPGIEPALILIRRPR